MTREQTTEPIQSDFSRRLSGGKRILELDGWHVWCCAPIYGEDGRVHVFFSRWPHETKHGGWTTHSEVAHAVADHPEGPYEVLGVALKNENRGGWDDGTIHNPTIIRTDGRYILAYMSRKPGAAPFEQKIGLATTDSLDQPWTRVGDAPVIEGSFQDGAWDYIHASNPSLIHHPNGQFWLYYKGFSGEEPVLRMAGLAVADRLEGPYRRHPENPLIDHRAEGKQVEDPYVFIENGAFKMIVRDMGVIDDRAGLIYESDDGIHWSEPKTAYERSTRYFGGEAQRFERPQILWKDDKPEYLFLSFMGGATGTSSGAVLKID